MSFRQWTIGKACLSKYSPLPVGLPPTHRVNGNAVINHEYVSPRLSNERKEAELRVKEDAAGDEPSEVTKNLENPFINMFNHLKAGMVEQEERRREEGRGKDIALCSLEERLERRQELEREGAEREREEGRREGREERERIGREQEEVREEMEARVRQLQQEVRGTQEQVWPLQYSILVVV